MNILNMWQVNLVLYWVMVVIWNQTYHYLAQKAKNDGALTLLLDFLAGVVILIFCPFFEFKFPTDIKIYFFLGLSIVFYTIYDRLMTPARKGLDSSAWSILSQISTVLMIFAGIIFFKEEFILSKIIGAVLIVASNILIFYKKGSIKTNKYLALGLLANLSVAIAGFLDVGISDNFNLPIYLAITYIMPAILIKIFERVKFNEITKEFKACNKKILIVTVSTWGLAAIFSLRAYLLGNVSVVAPLKAVNIILNVGAGYVFLKERDNLIKKIIAASIIVVGVILINM